jgi:hypothetical protein
VYIKILWNINVGHHPRRKEEVEKNAGKKCMREQRWERLNCSGPTTVRNGNVGWKIGGTWVEGVNEVGLEKDYEKKGKHRTPDERFSQGHPPEKEG